MTIWYYQERIWKVLFFLSICCASNNNGNWAHHFLVFHFGDSSFGRSFLTAQHTKVVIIVSLWLMIAYMASFLYPPPKHWRRGLPWENTYIFHDSTGRFTEAKQVDGDRPRSSITMRGGGSGLGRARSDTNRRQVDRFKGGLREEEKRESIPLFLARRRWWWWCWTESRPLQTTRAQIRQTLCTLLESQSLRRRWKATREINELLTRR